MKAFEFQSGGVQALNTKEFLALTETERMNIASVRFVPSELGAKGYGRFFVRYKRPASLQKRSGRTGVLKRSQPISL